jgi:SAM-dependent methyltransferase
MSDRPRSLRRGLSWTGERCLPWLDDRQLVYEHLHRYAFASELAGGKRVLDLGSGEGYGTALLAAAAVEVLGVEIDAESVEHATDNYARDNLGFLRASILELDDLPDASFDLVVCFEVIEHITEHDALLAVVRRLLAPDGIFIVSTPDRDVDSAAGHENPYHVRELARGELLTLLAGVFEHHTLWSQSLVVGSELQAEEGHPGTAVDVIDVRREGDRWERVEQPPPARYLVAVASSLPLPPLPRLSFLNHTDSGCFEGYVGRAELAVDPEPYELWEPERVYRQLAGFEAALAAELRANRRQGPEVDELRAEVAALRDALAAAETALADSGPAAAQLDAILASRAWRALSPYRRARTAVSRGTRRGQA